MLTFSVTVTLLDILLLRFFIYLSRFRAALSPRIDRWIQDGIFQLQRRAYETHAQWQDTEEEIPVTAGRELLPDLPLKKGKAEMQAYAPLVPSPSLGPQKTADLSSWQTGESTEVSSMRASLISSYSGESGEVGTRPPTPIRDWRREGGAAAV